jgi:hypothetical protein
MKDEADAEVLFELASADESGLGVCGVWEETGMNPEPEGWECDVEDR